MQSLFRVIREALWLEYQHTDALPRCGNDNKADRIHLNVREAVESIAEAYFSPEEKPIVLEIDPAGFADQIEWLQAGTDRPWPQPLANIPNLPVSAVVRVHTLEHSQVDGQNRYRMTD